MITVHMEITNVKKALKEITDWEERNSNFLRDLEHPVNWELTLKDKKPFRKEDTEINLLNNP